MGYMDGVSLFSTFHRNETGMIFLNNEWTNRASMTLYILLCECILSTYKLYNIVVVCCRPKLFVVIEPNVSNGLTLYFQFLFQIYIMHFCE